MVLCFIGSPCVDVLDTEGKQQQGESARTRVMPRKIESERATDTRACGPSR